MKCQNCSKSLGCSCSIRTASDGRRCCSSCIGAYENTLKLRKTQTKVHAQLFNNPVYKPSKS